MKAILIVEQSAGGNEHTVDGDEPWRVVQELWKTNSET